MGWWDRLVGRERFSASWRSDDPAFAAWWLGSTADEETVNVQTVLGLSAVLRSVQVISTTIAGLPLRSLERQGDEKVRIPTEFDDPWPGMDGLTPFSWTETVLIHLLLWREAFLWHEPRADGTPGIAYRPVNPDSFEVKWENGKRVFEYTDSNGALTTVDSTQITYIPGPSLDGLKGHPLLWAARSIFSAAISGDKAAQSTLKRGIRIGGLLTPGDNEDDFEPAEVDATLESLRSKIVGREHAGDLAFLNRKVKLQAWNNTSNVDSQWIETKQAVLGDIERIFGVPPHLLADTEKQTSWGTGVQEQNRGFQQYTLMGWSTRIEQVLSRRLPRDQFVEFDYKGLLQGTPAQEIELLISQVEAGLLTHEEARKVMNLPPVDWSQIPSKDDAETLITLVNGGLMTHDEARAVMGMSPIEWSTDLSDTEKADLIEQVKAGIVTHDEARSFMGLPAMEWSEDLSSDKVEQVAELVKAGFDPAAVNKTLGLPAIKHTGLPPITVQKLADAQGAKPMAPADTAPVEPVAASTNGRHP